MQEIIDNFLNRQGLNATDRKLYLALHQHGLAHASTLSLRTEVDRTTVYSSLKRLLKAGVVAQTQSGGARAYMALPPEVFVDKVEHAAAQLRAEKRQAEVFVDAMRTLTQGNFKKHKVSIFEGKTAIISLYNLTLAQPGEQRSFLTLGEIPAGLSEFLRKTYITSKLRKQVSSRVLLADSAQARRYKTLDGKSNRRSRIVKKLPFDLHAEIILWDDDKVAIIDFHQQIYGLLIESGTLHDTLAAMFEYVWASERAESAEESV